MRHMKLQQPPRSRQRVREVARDVGISAEELLQVLSEMGEYVKSTSSYIEAPIIRRVHERFVVTPSSPKPTSSAPQKPQPKRSIASPGLAPPSRRTKRDNHPLMDEPGPRSDRDVACHSRSVGEMPRASWTGRTVEQQWADLAGGDASQTFEFEDWKLRGFSEVDRDVWMSAGLRAGQARWAAELQNGGLSPSDLGVDLHGWKVIDRLQRGEGAKAVARMLNTAREAEVG